MMGTNQKILLFICMMCINFLRRKTFDQINTLFMCQSNMSFLMTQCKETSMHTFNILSYMFTSLMRVVFQRGTCVLMIYENAIANVYIVKVPCQIIQIYDQLGPTFYVLESYMQVEVMKKRKCSLYKVSNMNHQIQRDVFWCNSIVGKFDQYQH